MNKYNDLEKTVQSDLEESATIRAYNISKQDCSKADIIRILTDNDDEIKPFALINLKSLDNKKEAELFLDHLTGQDGRIREAVSFMLLELCDIEKYFEDEKSLEILVNGLLDINPNVVRNVIFFISKSENLKKLLYEKIISKTNEVIIELSKFIKEDSKFFENQSKSSKNHAKNKFTFNLYWLLSAISVFEIDNDVELNKILTKTANFLDYTIREKTALILSKMKNPPFELLRELKNDENIYVKNQLL